MTITLGEKEIELEYITINQYREMEKNPDMKDIDFISFITGLPIKDLRDVENNQISFVAKFLRTWTNSLQKTPLSLTREYKGQTLGLLSPVSMTYGEHTDLHTLLTQTPINFDMVSSILYRPVIEGEGEDRKVVKYDYDECKERAKDMGDFPINDYIAALFFLTKFSEIQLDDFLLSMVNKEKKVKTTEE